MPRFVTWLFRDLGTDYKQGFHHTERVLQKCLDYEVV